MFIENIKELEDITKEIQSLSLQLEAAFQKLHSFEIKISPEYSPAQESVQV